MNVLRYRKKPIIVEVARWDSPNVAFALVDWADGAVSYDPHTSGPSGLDGEDWGRLSVETLEGEHVATPGDWLLKGVAGEFYFCKPDIFAATYELAS